MTRKCSILLQIGEQRGRAARVARRPPLSLFNKNITDKMRPLLFLFLVTLPAFAQSGNAGADTVLDATNGLVAVAVSVVLASVAVVAVMWGGRLAIRTFRDVGDSGGRFGEADGRFQSGHGGLTRAEYGERMNQARYDAARSGRSMNKAQAYRAARRS